MTDLSGPILMEDTSPAIATAPSEASGPPTSGRTRLITSALLVIAGFAAVLAVSRGWVRPTQSPPTVAVDWRHAAQQAIADHAAAASPAEPAVDTGAILRKELAARDDLKKPTAEVAALSDAELTKLVTGVWRCRLYGDQTIHNDPAGSGKLDIVLDTIASFFYGDRMTIDVTWNVTGGVLNHQMVRGEPKENVDKLIRDKGDHRCYLILDLKEGRMELQDIDRPELFRMWTRLPEGE